MDVVIWDSSLVELFLKGGFAMWPLLVCSIVGLAILIERSVVVLWYTGDFTRQTNRLRSLLSQRKFNEAKLVLRKSRLPAARVAETFIDQRGQNPSLRDEIAERIASEQIVLLETRLNWLAVIASVAPMLGLLGTVTGLVSAFHTIEMAGGAVQPSDLSKGIWEALITTVFGLVIGIPALAAHHFFDYRASTLTLQMEWMLSHLREAVDGKPASKTVSPPLAEPVYDATTADVVFESAGKPLPLPRAAKADGTKSPEKREGISK